MPLEQIKLSLNNSPIRRETLHGKPHIVAPVAMLTEGVHNGSGGPLLYKETDCAAAVPAWNMKPVVVYHPTINGQGVSAADPSVLETYQVGIVMNTAWRGKLRCEAWIDEELAEKVDNRVLQALENNQVMEVSTGLFTTNVKDPGEWNGEAYDAIATNHQPDHLALLPDQKGACSVADGAGLLQMNEAAEAADVPEGRVVRVMAMHLDAMRRMIGNQMSHNDLRDQLYSLVNPPAGDGAYVWIVDVYEDHFVYEHDDKGASVLYRQGYTITDDTTALDGDRVEVHRRTSYVPVNDFVGNSSPTQPQKNKEDTVDKEATVNALIANAETAWGEDHREQLMATDDAILQVLGDHSAPAPAEATEATPTVDQYIANAPAQIGDVLRNALATQAAQKQALIAQITANAKNPFSAEFLSTKPVEELQGLAALATPDEQAAPASVPMFRGAAGAAAPLTNASEAAPAEPLLVPTLNFQEG